MTTTGVSLSDTACRSSDKSKPRNLKVSVVMLGICRLVKFKKHLRELLYCIREFVIMRCVTVLHRHADIEVVEPEVGS
jgi:hypothetical protein